MEKLMNEIQTRIDAEKLLFCNKHKDDYTQSQKELIVKGIAKKIRESQYYIDLFLVNMKTLLSVTKDCIHNEELQEDIATISESVTIWKEKRDKDKLFDYDYINFYLEWTIGYDCMGSYANFLDNNFIDVTTVRNAFDEGRAYENYNNNINFVLTNNFLLSQYPDFYSESDLEQLKTIALNRDKKQFKNPDDYRVFKRATKTTLKNIKKHDEKQEEKAKVLKK